MKCPKCQNEINSNAKFCTKCGCNLAVEMANAAKKSVQQTAQRMCSKCGSPIKEGAKFCIKCGTPIKSEEDNKAPQNSGNETVFLYGNDSNNNSDDSKTVVINRNDITENNDVTVPDDIVPPENNNKKNKKEKKKEPKQKEPKQSQDGSKAGVGLIIAVIVLFIMIIASGIVCYLVWTDKISLPFLEQGLVKTEQENSSEDETSSEEDTDAETSVNISVDTTELFAEADALLEEGKNQVGSDAEALNGLENLRNAMYQFAEKAEKAGDASIASDKIAQAYSAYISGVIRHKDLMNGQALSGSIYNQIMSEINEALALADEFKQKGYTLDVSVLTNTRDEFDASYKNRIITAFDDFTTRTTWSRTEAWNLMADTSGMFDVSDLDNPIRLRYAYALSWWVQKQIETELASGTITAKGAAIKIANMIDTLDYNPMMIDYYIKYMQEAGVDCSEVVTAYNEMIDHINQTQGIKIGTDIPLDHFWYFNDFGTYSVDDTNGVTTENRQWIRDRMKNITFEKQ